MPTVYFQTFGCQMNVADSNIVLDMLEDRGYYSAVAPEDADLIIVNTCSVREHAEYRARARIGEFSAIKRRRKGAQLWVIGCMAERLGEKLKREIPGVDMVIGARKMEDVGVLESVIDEVIPAIKADQGVFPHKNVFTDFVPVMRGCNNFCAYCIVPYVRGPELSIRVQEIEQNIQKKVLSGTKEVTLLGQNVNSYNDNGMDFADLLIRIASIPGIERVRFTTSHPKDCSEKLIRTVAEVEKCCNHIHLPVQSGSDRILEKMNRKYTARQYLNLIDSIRKYIPEADITTDILVGFPTETEQEYNATLSLVSEVGFTTAFMFAYSKREGTVSAQMEDTVKKDEKLQRLQKLIALQTDITRKKYASMVGTGVEVLVTGKQEKREKMWIGQDNGCKRVLLPCTEPLSGTILNVCIVRSSGMTLIGERI